MSKLAFAGIGRTEFSWCGVSDAKSRIKRAHELGYQCDCICDLGNMNGLANHAIAIESLRKSAIGKIKDSYGKKIKESPDLKDQLQAEMDAGIQKAKEEWDIKPIHGMGLYVIDPIEPLREIRRGASIVTVPRYGLINVIFRTRDAFQLLCEKAIAANKRAVTTQRGGIIPLFTFDELHGFGDSVLIGTGDINSLIHRYIQDGRIERAEQVYQKLLEIVPAHNILLEIIPAIDTHEWKQSEGDVFHLDGEFAPKRVMADGSFEDKQQISNREILKIGAKFGGVPIISDHSEFAHPDDKLAQDVKINNGLKDKRLLTRFFVNRHMLSLDESLSILRAQLPEYDESIFDGWIQNSYYIKEMCKGYTFRTAEKDGWLLPTMEMLDPSLKDIPPKQYLKELIRKYGRMPAKDDPRYPIYAERLQREVQILSDNGIADFLPYFFVIEDVVNFCNKEGVLFNTRGSGGGCLTLYLIGASITDPIKYDLQMERFLTLGRIKSGSLPDLDMDFSDRSQVLEYIYSKYGSRVALITNDIALRVKNAIRDIERALLGEVLESTNEMTKLMPSIPQGKDGLDWLLGSPDSEGERSGGWIDSDEPGSDLLRKYREDRPDLWETLLKCVGIARNKGVHACGVIIAPVPITSILPVIELDGQPCTAYSAKGVEGIGGVKFDFLGVKTLKGIELAVKSVRDRHNINLLWDHWEDKDEIYENYLCSDKVAGLFQIDTYTMRPFVKKIKPRNIEELSAIIALIRPGTLDAPSPDPSDLDTVTAVDYYIKCANKEREPYFIHPDLAPILGVTYGVILYQEQSLRIFRDIGGYSWEQAEDARRGIGKKNEAILLRCLNDLKSQCLVRGWTEAQAQRLFDSIKASARYSFNKSHSISYALVSYNGAYLKHMFPVDFWKGELTRVSENIDTVREYINRECHLYLAPANILNVNIEDWNITNEKSVHPLNAIKGIGGKNASALIHFRYGFRLNDQKFCPSIAELPTLDNLYANLKAMKVKGSVSIATGESVSFTIPNLYILLFLGMMDILEGVRANDIEQYHEIAAQIAKIAKSKTKPAKELCEITKNDQTMLLDLWRMSVNPIYEFKVPVKYFHHLKSMGFAAVNNRIRGPLATRPHPYSELWSDWNTLTSVPWADYYRDLNECSPCVVGVITGIEERPYRTASGDTRMSWNVTILGNNRQTMDFKVWPNKKTGEISAMDAYTIKIGKVVMVSLRLGLFKEKYVNKTAISVTGFDSVDN